MGAVIRRSVRASLPRTGAWEAFYPDRRYAAILGKYLELDPEGNYPSPTRFDSSVRFAVTVSLDPV